MVVRKLFPHPLSWQVRSRRRYHIIPVPCEFSHRVEVHFRGGKLLGGSEAPTATRTAFPCYIPCAVASLPPQL